MNFLDIAIHHIFDALLPDHFPSMVNYEQLRRLFYLKLLQDLVNQHLKILVLLLINRYNRVSVGQPRKLPKTLVIILIDFGWHYEHLKKIPFFQ